MILDGLCQIACLFHSSIDSESVVGCDVRYCVFHVPVKCTQRERSA